MPGTKQQANSERKKGVLIFSTLVRPVFLHKYFQPAWMRARKRNPRKKHKPHTCSSTLHTMSNQARTTGTVTRGKSLASVANDPPTAGTTSGNASARGRTSVSGKIIIPVTRNKTTAAPKKGGRGQKAANAKKEPMPQEESDTEMDKPKTLPDQVTDEDDHVSASEAGEGTSADNAPAMEVHEDFVSISGETTDTDAQDDFQSEASTTTVKDMDTLGSTNRLYKRKSETIEDEPPFTPGLNSFAPLFEAQEPVTKKAKQTEKEEEWQNEQLDDYEKEYQQDHPPQDTSTNEACDQGSNDIMPTKEPIQPRTLVVKAPRQDTRYAEINISEEPIDPFARRLPGAEQGERAPPPRAQPDPTLPKLAPVVPPNQAAPPSLVPANPHDLDIAMMFAPTTTSSQTTSTAFRDESQVIIHTEFNGLLPPHSIAPQHVFHNYDSKQIANLFSSRKPGDILVIVWGLEYRNLTYATEARIGAAIRAFFPNKALNLQIAPPSPPPSYNMKGPLPPTTQRFIVDHTGTPFTFYVCGLEPKMKAEILQEGFLPTSLDSYQILDANDFVTDFVFTIDGLNAPPDEMGQRLVEKMAKDQLYVTNAVWAFLSNHHDAIDPSIPAADVPSLIILSLEARGIWIEGRRGEPGRQAWNIWIAHPTKVPAFHLQWLAALKSAFPIRSASGFGGVARVIDVPFFCKGCKGESHPTSQCPLKEKLGDLLQRPRDAAAQRGKPKSRGGRGGKQGTYNGRPTVM
ncbi:hypothetical protein IW261DRAFT_1569749 [Armillaria novae-zelandiae]|uniref:Uncharacterized protein n=1 Tax=Armillaria novae-zelandiae TaxID=153914 RepID=A0AA39NWU3_9AGAR|nr:hypothetical protein IW261DRAFT_1569749 [Armillaria novae-zelandiae]